MKFRTVKFGNADKRDEGPLGIIRERSTAAESIGDEVTGRLSVTISLHHYQQEPLCCCPLHLIIPLVHSASLSEKVT